MLDGEQVSGEAVPRASQGTEQDGFKRVHGAVGMRARRGEPLSTIEAEEIAPSALSDENKSELRQHGLAHLDSGSRRYQERQDQVRRKAGRATPARGNE